MLKRIFDVAVAAVGLLILWPLFVVVPICIKRDSPGPVFYRQQRVGRLGVVFRIHKFRSMRVDSPATALQITPTGDPRITRSGRWLRASKLDELPQLIDVLQGTMSLVGPRPEVPRYVAMYPPALRDIVLGVRPGITDPASLAFRDEGELLARSADPEREYVDVVMPAKLRLSADYIARADFISDLQVIGATLATVIRGTGQHGPANPHRPSAD